MEVLAAVLAAVDLAVEQAFFLTALQYFFVAFGTLNFFWCFAAAFAAFAVLLLASLAGLFLFAFGAGGCALFLRVGFDPGSTASLVAFLLPSLTDHTSVTP